MSEQEILKELKDIRKVLEKVGNYIHIQTEYTHRIEMENKNQTKELKEIKEKVCQLR